MIDDSSEDVSWFVRDDVLLRDINVRVYIKRFSGRSTYAKTTRWFKNEPF